jgi:hypothetical protein
VNTNLLLSKASCSQLRQEASYTAHDVVMLTLILFVTIFNPRLLMLIN